MRKELDEELCRKYPEIFRDRHGNPVKSWMFECSDGWYGIIDSLCFNIQSYIENNRERIKTRERILQEKEFALQGNWDAIYTNEDGKKWLATATPEQLENIKEYLLFISKHWEKEIEEIPQVIAEQVKEKFGTLRFYVNYQDDYITGLIDMAESMSGRTCEVCGNHGKMRHGGWMRVLCDEHAKEAGYEVEENLP
jgi:hypothetical protein